MVGEEARVSTTEESGPGGVGEDARGSIAIEVGLVEEERRREVGSVGLILYVRGLIAVEESAVRIKTRAEDPWAEKELDAMEDLSQQCWRRWRSERRGDETRLPACRRREHRRRRPRGKERSEKSRGGRRREMERNGKSPIFHLILLWLWWRFHL